MRILDRQRYWAFLKAYVICFTSLVSLYIVIDAFSNFDEFTKRASGVSDLSRVMGRYYLVHTSEFYDRLCGVIGMMAAIFTVTWMQKNNELLAMLAAGISTHRVIRPVILSSVIVSGLAVFNHEWIMPELGEELQQSHADDGTWKVRVFTREDENRIELSGKEADRDTRTIFFFNATLHFKVYGTMKNLGAKQARYIPLDDRRSPLNGGWLLRGAKLSPALDDDGMKNGPVVHLADAKGFPPTHGNVSDLGGETYFLRSEITFQALTRSRRWYQFAPTVELIQGLGDPANGPEKMEIAVFLHNRMIRPLLGLALLLVTLPQVLGGYGRNMFIGLGISLGTAAVFYGIGFMSQHLGSHEVISPELSAWAPLIGFGTFAAARWGAIRT